MGLQVCDTCRQVLWCSVGTFYVGEHAKGCPEIGKAAEGGSHTCPQCKEKCNGLVNDKYCIKCWTNSHD